MGWVTDLAPTSEELNACVTCGLCLPSCPTFRLTGDESASPRGRLAAMAAVAGGGAQVDARFDEVMSFCLQCRACEAVCPSLVPFGRAMEGARAELAVQRPSTRRRLAALAFGRLISARRLLRLVTLFISFLQRLGLTDALPSSLGQLRGLRRLPLSPPTVVGGSWAAGGTQLGTVALLSGCVMEPWFSDVHRATIQVLRTAGYDVEVPAGQVCCGALAAHAGAAAETRVLAERNLAAFAPYATVVVNSAGCGAHLKDLRHWTADGGALGGKIVDVNELVARLITEGDLPRLEPHGGMVAVQEPCHLRHAQRVVSQPLEVLRAAGWEPVIVDPDGLCCGAAGVYAASYAETSDELGRRKASQIRATGARLVAAANPGCELQLRQHMDTSVRIAHPIELYWESIHSAG